MSDVVFEQGYLFVQLFQQLLLMLIQFFPEHGRELAVFMGEISQRFVEFYRVG